MAGSLSRKSQFFFRKNGGFAHKKAFMRKQVISTVDFCGIMSYNALFNGWRIGSEAPCRWNGWQSLSEEARLKDSAQLRTTAGFRHGFMRFLGDEIAGISRG
jgi:hypothetical protein